MHGRQELQCLLRLLTLLASADGRAVGDDVLREALTCKKAEADQIRGVESEGGGVWSESVPKQ